MSYTKYVMLNNGVFAFISKYAGVEHSVLVSFVGNPNNVASAGFIYLHDNGDLQTYGQSVSLGIKCDEADGDIISNALKTGNITIVENDRAGFFFATNDPNAVGERCSSVEVLQNLRILERD